MGRTHPLLLSSRWRPCRQFMRVINGRGSTFLSPRYATAFTFVGNSGFPLHVAAGNRLVSLEKISYPLLPTDMRLDELVEFDPGRRPKGYSGLNLFSGPSYSFKIRVLLRSCVVYER